MRDFEFHLLARANHQNTAGLERFDQAENAANVVDTGRAATLVKQISDHGAVTVASEQLQQQPAIDLLVEQMHAFYLRLDGQDRLVQEVAQFLRRRGVGQQSFAVRGG